jgi:hypothetical protein
MNYTELFNTIKSYCENDFAASAFTATNDTTQVVIPSSEQVDTFIRQAEQRIYNTGTVPVSRANQYGQLVTDIKYLDLPPNFLDVFSLAVLTDTTAGLDSPQEFLLNKDVSFIRASYPDPTVTGLPRYYAIFGAVTGYNQLSPNKELSLIVAPTPDEDYRVELHYMRYPDSIVDVGSSWLGDNFDSVLLYGALLEAITFMKGEADMVGLYDKRYSEALMLYKQLVDGKQRRDAYRSGLPRVPAT